MGGNINTSTISGVSNFKSNITDKFGLLIKKGLNNSNDLINLVNQIKYKKSYLCVGLDSDINKIPKHLRELEDPIYEFNKRVIDATKDLVVAYKPNIAFYEAQGSKGLISLEKTLNYIPENIFKIADAKRGDIGNTSKMYAKSFFESFNFDAVTLSPYMGKDSSIPYLEYKDKWIILLALTSNNSSVDIQHFKNSTDKYLLYRFPEKLNK